MHDKANKLFKVKKFYEIRLISPIKNPETFDILKTSRLIFIKSCIPFKIIV